MLGQVNTEALRSGDENPGIQHNLEIDFAYISGNSEILDFYGSYQFDFLSNSKLQGFFIAEIDRSIEESDEGISIFTNKGFAHLRISRPIFSQVQLEGFLQKEFNHFIELKNRELAGMGLRSNPIPAMYLGTGVMLEKEQYEVGGPQNFMKSTSYLNYIFNCFESMDISNILYYQFKLNEPDDHRILWDGKLTLNSSRNISFHISCHYRFDVSELNPKGNSFFELRNGIGVQF